MSHVTLVYDISYVKNNQHYHAQNIYAKSRIFSALYSKVSTVRHACIILTHIHEVWVSFHNMLIGQKVDFLLRVMFERPGAC